MKNIVLPLRNDDPRVIAARNAEKALFDFYGIQAKEHYVTLPEQQLRVRILEFGTGEPLVIIPGNVGDAFVLASLLAELKGRRIFAINRPGGGLSDGMDHTKVDIRAFANQSMNTVFEGLGLENADVVAHSMGAHWATLLALEHPGKVAKLALLGNPGNIMGGKPPLALRLMASPPLAKLALRVMIPKNKEKALRTLTIMGHSKQFVATLPVQLGEAYFRFNHLPNFGLSAISLLQNMVPEIHASELAGLKQPTALILGTKDNFLSQENGQKITQAMCKGTFFPVKNSGHLPWLEGPELVGKVILNFFGEG